MHSFTFCAYRVKVLFLPCIVRVRYYLSSVLLPPYPEKDLPILASSRRHISLIISKLKLFHPIIASSLHTNFSFPDVLHRCDCPIKPPIHRARQLTWFKCRISRTISIQALAKCKFNCGLFPGQNRHFTLSVGLHTLCSKPVRIDARKRTAPLHMVSFSCDAVFISFFWLTNGFS